MDKISLKIKLMYDEMGKAEKQIADWIGMNPGKIISLSIVELAEQCRCSEATIVRFSKRLGMSGFQELKISLAAEGGGISVNTHISKDDTPFEMYEKVCNDVFLSLEKTKKSLDADALQQAADSITNANKIFLFGLGNSASVAQDSAHKFLRAGLQAFAYSDNHMQVIAASHLTQRDAILFFSYSGSTKDLIDLMEVVKKRRAKVILVTRYPGSPGSAYADVVLQCGTTEGPLQLGSIAARIAQLYLVDVLFSEMCRRDLDQCRRQREQMADIMSGKHV